MVEQRQEQEASRLAFITAPIALRIAAARGSVSQTWPACREPDAMPTRKALNVAAKAVALDPLA